MSENRKIELSGHATETDASPVMGAGYGIIDPDYARAFTIARIVAWQYGYAIAMHGSFTRDLDLVMVPWTAKACEPLPVVNQIAEAAGLRVNGDPGAKPHGRLAWTLFFPAFGDPRWIDLSVMPRAPQPLQAHQAPAGAIVSTSRSDTL